MFLMTEILCVYCVETHWYSGSRVILRVTVIDVTAAARSGLTWSVVYVAVVGGVFGSVGCHAMRNGAELTCELDYTILFWLWILSWNISAIRGDYPHFVEISTFCGYYPHFVEISTFRGYYPHFVYVSVFRGYYLHLAEITMFRGYYPHFVRPMSHILLI